MCAGLHLQEEGSASRKEGEAPSLAVYVNSDLLNGVHAQSEHSNRKLQRTRSLLRKPTSKKQDAVEGCP